MPFRDYVTTYPNFLLPDSPGGLVKKDEAYVELEAMKMIMPLKVGLEGSKFPKEWESPKIPKAPKEIFKSYTVLVGWVGVWCMFYVPKFSGLQLLENS